MRRATLCFWWEGGELRTETLGDKDPEAVEIVEGKPRTSLLDALRCPDCGRSDTLWRDVTRTIGCLCGWEQAA